MDCGASPEELAKFTGLYECGEGYKACIFMEGNALKLSLDDREFEVKASDGRTLFYDDMGQQKVLRFYFRDDQEDAAGRAFGRFQALGCNGKLKDASQKGTSLSRVDRITCPEGLAGLGQDFRVYDMFRPFAPQCLDQVPGCHDGHLGACGHAGAAYVGQEHYVIQFPQRAVGR